MLFKQHIASCLQEAANVRTVSWIKSCCWLLQSWWLEVGPSEAAGQMNHDFRPLKEAAWPSRFHFCSANIWRAALRLGAFIKDVLCMHAAFFQHFLKIYSPSLISEFVSVWRSAHVECEFPQFCRVSVFIKVLRLHMNPNFHVPCLPNPESWIGLHSHFHYSCHSGGTSPEKPWENQVFQGRKTLHINENIRVWWILTKTPFAAVQHKVSEIFSLQI